MKLWHFLTGWLDDDADAGQFSSSTEIDINPANGLPMIEGSGIDIEGNPFGTSCSDVEEFYPFGSDD